jgi:hypothetical protein
MRHPKPDILIKYETQRVHLRESYPRICHTCDFYTDNGVCERYGSEPPQDFAQTQNQCQEWKDIIPF